MLSSVPVALLSKFINKDFSRLVSLHTVYIEYEFHYFSLELIRVSDRLIGRTVWENYFKKTVKKVNIGSISGGSIAEYQDMFTVTNRHCNREI